MNSPNQPPSQEIGSLGPAIDTMFRGTEGLQMDAEVAISAVLGPADYASGIRALDLSANYSYWRAYTKEHREDPTDISPESIVAIRAINEVEKMCVANLRANPGVLDSAVSDPEDYWLVRTMPTHLINQVLTEKMSKPAQ